MVELSRDPLLVRSAPARASDRQVGAEIIFQGLVRAENRRGRDLVALEYTAYETMARRVLAKIEKAALEKWSLIDIAIFYPKTLLTSSNYSQTDIPLML